MAMKKDPSKLGSNPLSQGIFEKTDADDAPTSQNLSILKQESRIKDKESRFLKRGEREATNLRLPIELNDWLNELLKTGKRRHGSKVPKEVWVQAAIELFRAMPVDWEEIDSIERLQKTLKSLESRIKNQVS
jgi:hypothetical protein